MLWCICYSEYLFIKMLKKFFVKDNFNKRVRNDSFVYIGDLSKFNEFLDLILNDELVLY